ncbi:MAG: 50S ribosomal protein L20 [Candidatus Terrybacteria bacterium RIFCSPHIGHO2_01_FULL_58_15]|uniref:Large ribosomal subunit protein bL20 n=1 Tax=Terrybacteria sp. (strain RIFCSPHIGHO2_01_FULL_58_15) TaxID=1802363 RepID=A0A1G2PNW0_TERXR|nr:MAG: 50S ribosomal protein L20 [Candidatus Terrybacteria bacterium RIFCSPHIGHO2_01_FULL_58_15]
MARVKRGTTKTRKRERLLKRTKGYRWRRKSTARAAKQALMKAWSYQYRDRRRRKRDFRALWNVRINAAARADGITYHAFIAGLKRNNIALDRKVLAELALAHPEIFKEILKAIKS